MKHRVLICLVGALLYMQVGGAQVSINIATGTIGQDYDLLQAAVTRFMQANPDVSVRLLYVPEITDDRLGLFRNFFEAASPELDVLQLDTVWVPELAGHLHDLRLLVEATAGIDPRLLEDGTVDGRLVSMPWFISRGALFYRSDLLNRYGYAAPPASWQELVAMARTIQEGERAAGNGDFWGYVWQGGTYEGLTVNALEWLGSRGAGTLIEAPGVISIANERAEQVLVDVRSWISDISPPEVLEFSENDTFTVFVHGNAAFARGWPTQYARLKESPTLAGRYGIALMPTGLTGDAMGTGVRGGEVLAVSLYSRHPEAAFRLVDYLASEREQRIAATEGARIPTRPALYSDPQVLQALPFLPEFVTGVTPALSRPVRLADGEWSSVSRAAYSAFHDFLSGTDEPGPALRQLAQALQSLTGLPTGQPQPAP